MIPPMILKTERLNLRPLRSSDAPALFAILGDAEAMKFWDRPAIARTATAAEIVTSQLAAMEDGHFLYWTVWRNDDAIGSVDLSGLDFSHRRGEIGFLFRRDQWGQGYGREAMGALIHHAFHQLKLERLEAKVHAANMPAKKLLGLLGFRPEGCLSGHVLRDGIRHDVDVFGLLSRSSSQNGA
jgi:ribosomal-protein-alanine N-acetyltransferase